MGWVSVVVGVCLERQWQVEFQNLELYLVRQFNQSRSCQ